GHVFNALGEEGIASSGFSYFLQNVVAAVPARTYVGADRIDDGLGALAHFDRIVGIGPALVIVPVGDHDQRFAHGTQRRGRYFDQLITAGSVDCVKESRAATRPQLSDTSLEFVLIVGVVLGNVRGDVKAHGEGQICLRAHHLL